MVIADKGGAESSPLPGAQTIRGRENIFTMRKAFPFVTLAVLRCSVVLIDDADFLQVLVQASTSFCFFSGF
jgi:hypothetical protein